MKSGRNVLSGYHASEGALYVLVLAVLDGLPLQDDPVRLFAVDRDTKGRTVVKRVVINDRLRKIAATKDWPLSRLWMNKLIGGMPDV